MYREENNESHFGLALIYPTNLTNESKSLTLVQISLTLSINHGSFNNYVGLKKYFNTKRMLQNHYFVLPRITNILTPICYQEAPFT
jgi:hypothetical protein